MSMKMTKEERRTELQGLMHANYGALVQLYQLKVMGSLGALPPTGILGSVMIEQILEREFPAK